MIPSTAIITQGLSENLGLHNSICCWFF